MWATDAALVLVTDFKLTGGGSNRGGRRVFLRHADFPVLSLPGLDGVGVGLDVLDPLCSPCTSVFDYRTCAPSYYSLAFILKTI